MSPYSQFTCWSPVYDCEVARISVVNERNEEYYANIPNAAGSGFVALRKKAVAKLNEAIELGIEPGEIRWRS